ncbi:uncharacterized protein LOC113375803 [Ctenocephalides felis]|uniref:uncharacterized protein LOC113375803 n=1 Tax=Ctenocephalides felis TaxID=7515 RepID=UPI000E6E4613|nr:uncharacterized protein LOC113375803 [Ctenocephalides felis]
MAVLMISKLTGAAKSWFFSKAEYATYSYDEIKRAMTAFLQNSEDRMTRMRKFEARRWRRQEPFSSYFQEKMALGNRANVTENDMLAYMIDGTWCVDCNVKAGAYRLSKNINPISASSSIMELNGTLELQNSSHITEECSDLGSGEQSSTPRTRTTSLSIMELDGTLELQNGSHITEECSDLGSEEQSSTPRTRTTSSNIMELDGTLELQNGSHITEECSDPGSGEQSTTPRTR